MGDESPNAHESKSMIGLVPSAQQPTLQSSKVQNCQHWGQLLGGSLSTFLIALGEIISIFIYIFGFHWKIWMILTFDLHFGLGYFGIKCRNRGVWNGGQTSRSSKLGLSFLMKNFFFTCGNKCHLSNFWMFLHADIGLKSLYILLFKTS